LLQARQFRRILYQERDAITVRLSVYLDRDGPGSVGIGFVQTEVRQSKGRFCAARQVLHGLVEADQEGQAIHRVCLWLDPVDQFSVPTDDREACIDHDETECARIEQRSRRLKNREG
jgi:hypothetical protein